MRKLLQILFIFATPLSYAQFSQPIEVTEEISTLEKYAGSIYINKEYQRASVIDEKSGTYETKLKYNVYTDALEHTVGGKLHEVIKTPTTYARINNEYYYYCDFQNNHGRKKRGYYILVEMNDLYRVYKKYDLKITEPKEMDPLTGSAVTGKIKVTTTFYLEDDGVILELPMNKKDILLTFSDKEEELKQYIKKEKIRLKKEEDLLRLVAKYNALKNTGTSPSQSLLSNRAQNK
ncbi:hypothetical protein [Aquimarina mytili]|uniref:GLPGLI family protein n=1 Tax=Aquimarina mytili TaxID=874423 RepID=A0A936ZS22_9FLAO|nr:hypothetical protein [Aquimarina mytili]MBL0683658.1 hypothetical protein [Aquimarina mytili]